MYHYEYQGRNGYWAIDLYKGNQCLRMVEAFKTRKQAISVVGELNQALRYGKDESGN